MSPAMAGGGGAGVVDGAGVGDGLLSAMTGGGGGGLTAGAGRRAGACGADGAGMAGADGGKGGARRKVSALEVSGESESLGR